MTLLMLVTLVALANEAPRVEQTVAATKAAARQAEAEVLADVSVRVECTASREGRVSACVVLEESRPGLGFGQAALALMEGAEVTPPRAGAGVASVRFERTIQFMP